MHFPGLQRIRFLPATTAMFPFIAMTTFGVFGGIVLGLRNVRGMLLERNRGVFSHEYALEQDIEHELQIMKRVIARQAEHHDHPVPYVI